MEQQALTVTCSEIQYVGVRNPPVILTFALYKKMAKMRNTIHVV